jgi:hypothetical protein
MTEERILRRRRPGRQLARSDRAVVVRGRLASDRVEPRKRLARHLLELPPADEERLGHEIFDRVGRGTTPDVQGDVVAMALADLVERFFR